MGTSQGNTQPLYCSARVDQLAHKFAARLDQLAHKLAYSTARSDIECECHSVSSARPPGGSGWYDIASADPDTREIVDDAVTYLILRGKLVRFPDHPSWVRILDENDSGTLADWDSHSDRSI